MARRSLTFEESTLIGLQATPHRLLGEHVPEEQIVAELLHIASEFPKRTKQQLARYGQGTPTIRVDLIAMAVGRQRREHRLYIRRCGEPDYYFHDVIARLLAQAGEVAGGVDEAIVRHHEWPPRPERPLNLDPQRAAAWELEWLEDGPLPF